MTRAMRRPGTAVRCAGAGLGLAVCLAGTPAADAQPRGDFRVWAQERVEQWGPFGIRRSWEGGRFHGEGQFFPVNAGAWTVWWETSARGQELRFTGKDIPSSLGRLTLAMGDFAVVDPRKDPLRTEFQQTVWLRGASLRLDREAVSIEARGGVQTRREGLFAWGRTPVFGGSYGLTVSGPTGVDSGWKADWDHQETTLLGPGVHVLRTFWGVEPAEGVSLLSEMKLSRVDETGGWGNSQVLGAGYTRNGFKGRWHVRRVSPSFRGLGLYADPHANEWGTRLELSYRTRQRAVVGTSWDWGRDIMPRNGLPAPETRLITRFFVSAPVLDVVSLNGSVGYRNRSTHDPDSLLADQGALTWSGTVSYSASRFRTALGMDRSLYRDPGSVDGDWRENRVSVQGLVRLGETVTTDLFAWTVDRRFLDGRWASRERKVEGRITWEPRSAQRGWLRVGRDNLEARDVAYSRDQWELGTGWTQPLPWDLSLELETLFFARAGALSADRARVNFRLSRHFAMGGGRLGMREAPPEVGTIEGLVFEDDNGNGFQDPGERGIPDLILTLGSGGETKSNAEGRYLFPGVAAGTESVTLDVARLPTRYLAPEHARRVVMLGPGGHAAENYPIGPAAAVAGRVVLDMGNRSAGAKDVLVRIRGTHHDTFTDAEGGFVITGLAAGPATLEVMAWSLPPHSTPQGSLLKTVVLRPGQLVQAGVIVLDHHEQEVLQYFRPR
jgi:hypothetical protein